MLIPVILSGGAGTRLWPVSREGYPKPFMKLADGQSLLFKTYQRAASVAEGGEVLTVTNRDYYFMSKDELANCQLAGLHGSFLLEPIGRNTAPAIAMAALHAAEKHGRDSLLLVLAADHLVQDQAAFNAVVKKAKQLAEQDYLVTFGIVPDVPETGFGYIEAGESLGEGLAVKRFVEKPSLETAREYLTAGTFFWNSGMFCFKAGVILDELAKHAPEVMAGSRACWNALLENGSKFDGMLEIPGAEFAAVPDISIDYAVMERSAKVAMVPAAIGWSDIGSWNAVSLLVTPDAENNRVQGEAIFVDCKNTYIQSDGRLVAAIGVEDLLVIDTPDALLVAHPDKAQDVRQVVSQLKQQNHAAYKLHRTVARPWGTYTVLEEGPRFKMKRIEVKPGASLSLQMHHHRSEHWVVVSGMAKVVNGEREIFIRPNESTFIPAGVQHRLVNPGVIDCVMIEVQVGDYLGEDDIVRFDCIYGRS